LQRLERIGVGHDVGSVSIYKAELCKASSLSVYKQVQPSKGINGSSDHTTTSETTETLKSIEVARNEWKMAATRLRIEQVREEIIGSSEWNFDFIALVTIAGILAGVGLVTNNTGTCKTACDTAWLDGSLTAVAIFIHSCYCGINACEPDYGPGLGHDFWCSHC
jgi:hypothetical protein